MTTGRDDLDEAIAGIDAASSDLQVAHMAAEEGEYATALERIGEVIGSLQWAESLLREVSGE